MDEEGSLDCNCMMKKSLPIRLPSSKGYLDVGHDLGDHTVDC